MMLKIYLNDVKLLLLLLLLILRLNTVLACSNLKNNKDWCGNMSCHQLNLFHNTKYME
jgi:hypothetical protein